MKKPENWEKLTPLLALALAGGINAGCNPEKTSDGKTAPDKAVPQEIRLGTQEKINEVADQAELELESQAVQFEIWAFEFKQNGVAVKFSSIDDLRAFFTLRQKRHFTVDNDNIEFQLTGSPEMIPPGNYVLLPLDEKQLARLRKKFLDFANIRLPPLILEIK